MSKELVYQLRISLDGTKPEIWRTVLVPVDITFVELHHVIQSAFQWENAHLFEFTYDKTHNFQRIYFPKFDDEFSDIFEENDSENTEQISDVLAVGETIFYIYDMGDNWEHKILCEGLLIRPKGKRLPCCIDGAMNHAFEDVGGVWGYQDMVQALQDQTNPEHKEQLEWLVECFGKKILKYDPTAFDIKKIKF